MDEKGYSFKGARIEKAAADDDTMAKINRFTLSELTAEDVFTFKIAMCGNAVDRDFEAFTDEALEKMGELFVGRTIIKDHRHMADNQIGRIFATEVVSDPTMKGHDGREYKSLVAHCYMLKTEGNAELRAEINAGIKKEVSVGFRVSSAICSICGVDNAKNCCSHWWGREYDGKTCYFMLADVSDAYELSFVAVPAQREAGTVKGYNPTLEKTEAQEPSQDLTEAKEAIQGQLENRMRINDAYIYIKAKKED